MKPFFFFLIAKALFAGFFGKRVDARNFFVSHIAKSP